MRASRFILDEGVRVTHMLHVNSFLQLHHHIIDSRLEERPPREKSALFYLFAASIYPDSRFGKVIFMRCLRHGCHSG